MKNAMIVVLTALIFSAGAMAQRVVNSNPVIITGFKNNVYSVGRVTATQLMKNVVAPIKRKLLRTPNAEVIVYVQGCATTNGTDATNSYASQTRASNVEVFLSQQLQQYPNVKVKPWASGSSANALEVVVSTTTVIPAATSASKNDAPVKPLKFSIYTLFAAAIIVLFGIVVMIKSRTSDSAIALQIATGPATQQTSCELLTPPVVSEQALTKYPVEGIRPDGTKYRAFIFPQGPVWMTQFQTQKDSSKPIFRKEFRQAVYATQQCIANPYYQPAIDKLIAENKIEKVIEEVTL